MNHLSQPGRGSDAQQEGAPGRHAIPVRSADACRLAAAGACLASELCQGASGEMQGLAPHHGMPHRRVRRGEAVYRAGDAFGNLYQLYAGSVKLRIICSSGAEQIVSFPMAGALLGLDGIEDGTHTCDAIALEDSVVCIISFAELVASWAGNTMMALRLNKAIAHETGSYRRLLMALASMNSDGRVASFLMDISGRLGASGYSSRQLVLKMTRGDIAHHLGMQLETVSRVLGRLQSARILEVRRRRLDILDPDALSKIGSGY